MSCDMCSAYNQDYRIIEKNELCFSIVNAFPLREGHLMVLPRRHVKTMSELSLEELSEFRDMSDRLTARLVDKYNSGIINFFHANGINSQEHLHGHLLPSVVGMRILASTYYRVPSLEQAKPDALTRMRDYINS